MISLGCQNKKVIAGVFNRTNTLYAFLCCNKIKVVNIHTRETIQVFINMDYIRELVFNYNDTLIIGSDPYGYFLLIFDMTTGLVNKIPCYTFCIETPFCSSSENMVFIWCRHGFLYLNADIKPYQFKIMNTPIGLNICNAKYNSIRNILMVKDFLGKINLLNATTLTRITDFYSSAFTISFSSCGNFIVAVEPKNGICIYDLNGHKIRNFMNQQPMSQHKKEPIASFAIFGKNDTLISVQYDTGMIQFLNADTGDVVRTINDHSYVPHNTYNYCNKYVVTCTDQHEIILHDINITGKYTKPALHDALCDTSLDDTLLDYALRDTSLNETSLNDTSLNDTSLNDTSLNEPLLNKSLSTVTSLNETSLNDTSLNETSLNDTSSNETSLNDTSLNETLLNDTSLNDVLCDILSNDTFSYNTFIVPNLELELNLSELID